MVVLSAAGTEHDRNKYALHDAAGPSFDASFKPLWKSKKQGNRKHQLARWHWTTIEIDARIIATMSADADRDDAAALDAWMKRVSNSPLPTSSLKT
jgi:hypothetical protein